MTKTEKYFSKENGFIVPLLFTEARNLTVYKQHPLFFQVYMKTMIGVFMNIVCLARFINMLPGVKEKSGT